MSGNGSERRIRRAVICVGGAVLLALGVAMPVAEERGSGLSTLTPVQPGLWVLRGLDGTSPTRTLCIGDLRALLQVPHPQASCMQAVISSGNDRATVYNSCPGIGHAQTSIKVETARLAQIDSQGVSGNAPFALSYEARRTGDCTAAPTPRAH